MYKLSYWNTNPQSISKDVFWYYSADQALDRFAMKRFYDDKLGGLPQPSQRRYALELSPLDRFVEYV